MLRPILPLARLQSASASRWASSSASACSCRGCWVSCWPLQSCALCSWAAQPAGRSGLMRCPAHLCAGFIGPLFLLIAAFLLLGTNVSLVALLRHKCRGGRPNKPSAPHKAGSRLRQCGCSLHATARVCLAAAFVCPVIGTLPSPLMCSGGTRTSCSPSRSASSASSAPLCARAWCSSPGSLGHTAVSLRQKMTSGGSGARLPAP